jgi:hypothetical protein
MAGARAAAFLPATLMPRGLATAPAPQGRTLTLKPTPTPSRTDVVRAASDEQQTRSETPIGGLGHKCAAPSPQGPMMAPPLQTGLARSSHSCGVMCGGRESTWRLLSSPAADAAQRSLGAAAAFSYGTGHVDSRLPLRARDELPICYISRTSRLVSLSHPRSHHPLVRHPAPSSHLPLYPHHTRHPLL